MIKCPHAIVQNGILVAYAGELLTPAKAKALGITEGEKPEAEKPAEEKTAKKKADSKG